MACLLRLCRLQGLRDRPGRAQAFRPARLGDSQQFSRRWIRHLAVYRRVGAAQLDELVKKYHYLIPAGIGISHPLDKGRQRFEPLAVMQPAWSRPTPHPGSQSTHQIKIATRYELGTSYAGASCLLDANGTVTMCKAGPNCLPELPLSALAVAPTSLIYPLG